MRFLFNILRTVHKCTTRKYARNIIGDRVVNLNENTVTGRLLTYLSESENFPKSVCKTTNPVKILFCLKEGNSDSLTKVTNGDLSVLLKLLESKTLVQSDKDFYDILRIINEECCLRLPTMTTNEILLLLNAYLTVFPNRANEYSFYKKALLHLTDNVEDLNKNNLFQLFFYTGQLKKNEKSKIILKKCLKALANGNFFQNVSTEELCVICSSTFKTSTRIGNTKILSKICDHINTNLDVLKDPALLVTLIKSLRHNRYENEDLLSSISCAMFFNKSYQNYQFSTYCHILALYSDNLFYDEKLLKFFTSFCVDQLKSIKYIKKRTLNHTRGKDIKRLLWALSNLNYTFLKEEDFKEVLIPKIIERIQANEFAKDPESLIEFFLYLWMLNYKPYDLVPYTFTEEIAQKIRGMKQSSIQQRFNQLLTLIHFEDKQLFKTINIRPQGSSNFVLTQHLKNRPVLQRVFDTLQKLTMKLEIKKFELGYEIPYLNILGITGFTRNIYKAVFIEVMDDFTSLKNVENMPTGFMQLKLRILDGFEEAVIVVHQTEIQGFTEAELEEYLLDEIKLVC